MEKDEFKDLLKMDFPDMELDANKVLSKCVKKNKISISQNRKKVHAIT